MKHILTAGVILAAALLTAAPQKAIFAHYMGCFPIGYGPIDSSLKSLAGNLKHTSGNQNIALGGQIVNYPLFPQHQTISPEKSAELEIRRAMRAGIDGFAVDAWAGQRFAEGVCSQLIRAAERMKVPFQVTICLDPSCHPHLMGKDDKDMENAYTKSVSWLLKTHGKSPNLARRNGKVLIVGYASGSVIRENGFYKEPFGIEKLNRISQLYRNIEKRVGQKIYWHFCYDTLAWRDGAKKHRQEQAVWAGRNFDAVGGFLGNGWDDDPEFVKAVKAGGAEWSQPFYFQYNNKAGSLYSQKGFDRLFRCWDLVKKYDSTFLQFVTWNDYGEDTILAPGYSTNYTVMNLNRYLIDRWKLGKDPEVRKDVIHLSFRRMTDNAEIYPFRQRRRLHGVLEVVSILTSPGRIEVQGFGSYNAPKGLFRKQFELRPGKVSARLTRNGKTVLDFTAPEEITSRPWREDNSMVCFSSNFEEEWKADFGTEKPLLYSENGDVDNDGLPNWFELYYSGNFPWMNMAHVLKPRNDPDLDGQNNLAEYRNQTNPLEETLSYPTGYSWDFDKICAKGVSYNPDPDDRGRNVWTYHYMHGPAGKIPHAPPFPRITSTWQNVPYAGKMAHLSPSTDKNNYPRLHGWFARTKTPEGKWRMIVRPRGNAAEVLCWTSPVTGKVTFSCHFASVSGRNPLGFLILQNDTLLQNRSINPKTNPEITQQISVRKGDKLWFFFEDRKGDDSVSVQLDSFRIRLDEKSAE